MYVVAQFRFPVNSKYTHRGHHRTIVQNSFICHDLKKIPLINYEKIGRLCKTVLARIDQ
jgi:hypothetical protein